MGKKNIKPSINQPVIRTNVAKPAIEGLTEESLTSTNTSHGGGEGLRAAILVCNPMVCSYDGDDAE